MSAFVLRVVIYARRSQKHQDASVQTQIEEATRFVREKGWQLVGIYADDDKNTGRKEFKKRKEFLRLLSDANEGAFDVVVVRDNTRLGGDTSRTMRAVEDLIDEGVRVWYYIDEREVRLDNWVDKVSFAVQSAASEGERDGISSRTYEALKVKSRTGQNVGGRCYGFRNIPIIEGEKRVRTEYAIHDEQARVIVEVFRAYVGGKGVRAIAKDLNERGVPSPRAGDRGTGSWAPSQVWEILRRERYIGILRYGKTQKGYKKGTKVRFKREPAKIDPPIEKPELRIVPQELWDAALLRRTPTTNKPWATAKGRTSKHLLTGLAVCAYCGGGIAARTWKIGKVPTKVYHCGWYHDRGKAVCANSLRRPAAELESLVVDWFVSRFLTEDMVRLTIRTIRERIASSSEQHGDREIPELEQRAKQLRSEIDNLAEAVATTAGKVAALSTKLAERQEKLHAVEARLATLRTAPEVLSLEVHRLERDSLARLGELRRAFEDAPQEARRALESLLDGKLRFTPVETAQGRRYRIDGRATLGGPVQASLPDLPECLRPQRDSNPC